MQHRTGIEGRPVRHPVAAGAVGGIVAAVVMALFATVVAAAGGAGALAPAQLVGATLLEDAADQPVLSAVLGVTLHFLMGAGLGALFGLAVTRVRAAPLLFAAGLGYGAVVFVAMTYVVLPAINPLLSMALQPAWFFLYHLAFGLTLAASILVARARPARAWFTDYGHTHA